MKKQDISPISNYSRIPETPETLYPYHRNPASAHTFPGCGYDALWKYHLFPKNVPSVLSGTDAGGAAFTIRTLRFPRMLTAILCGMAFGLSGNTFQQLLGNPLASPDIIGVTSGASVAAVFGILILKLDYGIVAVMAAAFRTSGFCTDLFSFP